MVTLRAAVFAGLAGLFALTVAVRSVPALDFVFTAQGVNFQETDAWTHIRLIEEQARHWPRPMKHDPLGAYPEGQPSAVAPLFDFLISTIGLVAPVEIAAAWAPPVMAGLTTLAVFALARAVAGSPAAWLAALLAALLPGRWLLVGKLGFTDHHVLESLTVVLLLWALVERRHRLAGFCLGAYLLTWVGGALAAALVVCWLLLEALLSRSSSGKRENTGAYWTLGVALAMIAPFFDVLWMPYAIAVLAAGLAALVLLDRAGWRAVVALAAVTILALLAFAETRRLLVYFTPRVGAASVAELRPLLVRSGRLTVVPFFQEFTLVGAAAMAAIMLGLPRLLRREESGFRLLWGFAVLFLFMSITQERMSQYFAPAAAILGAMLTVRLVGAIARGRRAVSGLAWVVMLTVLAGPCLPFHGQLIGSDTGVPADWRDALAWLKDNSPDPAAQPYGVLNWWNSGYWITAIAGRMPLSNPTQNGARAAARLFLNQQADAGALLAGRGLRFAMVDSSLLMLPGEDAIHGTFASLVKWADDDISRYIQIFYRSQPGGSFAPSVYFMPEYFRTLIARIGLGSVWKKRRSAEAAEEGQKVLAIAWERKTRDGQPYKEIQASMEAPPEQAAAFVEEQLKQGRLASLVSEDPMSPCVPLRFPAGLRLVYPVGSNIQPEVLVVAVEGGGR